MGLFKAFRERIVAFRDDTQGSMAIMFALTFGAMISFAGAAIDLTRMVQATALLQQATDSAALAAVNSALLEGSDLASASSFNGIIDRFIESNLEIALANGAPVGMAAAYAVTVANGNLTITAQAPLVSGFTRLFGVQTLNIDVKTVVRIPPDAEPATAPAVISG